MNRKPSKRKKAKSSLKIRTGLTLPELRQAFNDHLCYTVGRLRETASLHDLYLAAAHTIRDRLHQRWLNTLKEAIEEDVRVVTYMSAEFLLGPHLGNNLINLGIYDLVEEAARKNGWPMKELLDQEEEPGLGNGGLGRLAACYMDSLSTLEVPAVGYGIRYEFGIFDQTLRNGWQEEITDKWLRYGNPWEIQRPERAITVKFGGRTDHYHDEEGHFRTRWIPEWTVKGVPFDTPILGYGVNTCNTLRLWSAEACESFDFEAFNVGDYYGAVDEKVTSENLTKVLYPNDEPIQGKRLRLEQQYFFVSCSLQDMIRIHLMLGKKIRTFHKHFAVQLNDTHPSVGVAELMRLLVDEHGLDWGKAWEITRKTFAYTNHTLLPEALETWPVELFGQILPRHLEIIYEINDRFLEDLRNRYPGDEDRIRRMSIIDDQGHRKIRMAHLATVGSFAVNGVAALHTDLLKENVLHDFHELDPSKFSNKTNGVTPRRFLVLSNPSLTRLLRSRIGESWIRDLNELKELENHIENARFRKDWRRAKRENKVRLAEIIKERTGVVVDPDSMFDVLVKRIHEYKRQHLSVLHLLTLYRRLKENPELDIGPRTAIFAGKAAPAYFMAKLIIKLINNVADVVNNDPDVRDRLKVVFLPDFNVKNAQPIYPAADLSEQISMAGKEASGTGNMKFSMNGALTIGTLDGANVEIREEVGEDNFFLFGLSADEVIDLKREGYRPRDYYDNDEELRGAIDLLTSETLTGGDTNLFRPLVDHLLEQDEYLLLADYRSYVDCQSNVGQAYMDAEGWTRMSILNVARIGKFSSDRAIREYCKEIWKVKAVPISLSPSE